MAQSKNTIRAIGTETEQGAALGTENAAESGVDAVEAEYSDIDFGGEYDAEFDEEYETQGSRFGWLGPAIAIFAVAAWTGLYGWALRVELLGAASAAPAQWTRWIIDWSVPVLLVGVVWLIAMRNSRKEAQRFAATASALSHESAQLEKRLNVVNRELSLAREFLGAQSLELESLGRVASEKISAHASELQELIKTNGKQVDRIGSASETALANMTSLRDDLPVVANSARDVSNQVGNAGRTANDQLDKLVAGFERLNQFGKASEQQVTSLGERVQETLANFEGQLSQIETLVSGRFTTLQSEAGAYRDEVGAAEETAIAALNDRIAALQSEARAVSASLRDAEAGAMDDLKGSKERLAEDIEQTVNMLSALDEQALEGSKKRIADLTNEVEGFNGLLAQRDARFLEEMERRQAAFETRETQATEALAQRLSDLDDIIAARREAQLADTEKLIAQSEAMSDQLDKLSGLLGSVNEASDTARESLNTGLGDFEQQLASKRAALDETQAQLGQLTEDGIRLLEIIQSGARTSREDLPEAIQAAAGDLGQVEERAEALSGVMFRTSQQGSELSDYLVKTQETISETDESLGQLQSKLAEQSEDTLAKLQGLRAGFAKLSDEGQTFAGDTSEALAEALHKLETATKSAFAALDDGAREKVGVLAEELSSEAVQALERSLRNQSAETIGKLEQAASHASGVGREATVQLRDQLAKVNELTGNLEQRIARAREQSEEQVNNDFARRMSLITDSLNSNAIDITSALSTDVTDTAWDAYLKGDRGIFTRRAVSLIDGGDAKEIADLYQEDDTFKANVTRYIHDFEKMLRAMLSTRDGNALSVTLLGSDMGKLYVVLAQAIERFRT